MLLKQWRIVLVELFNRSCVQFVIYPYAFGVIRLLVVDLSLEWRLEHAGIEHSVAARGDTSDRGRVHHGLLQDKLLLCYTLVHQLDLMLNLLLVVF